MTLHQDLDAPVAAAPRYREFPHLFWDLAPDALVDIDDDVILTRLLVHGRISDLRRTHALTAAPPRLRSLHMPEHIRRFWEQFFEETHGG